MHSLRSHPVARRVTFAGESRGSALLAYPYVCSAMCLTVRFLMRRMSRRLQHSTADDALLALSTRECSVPPAASGECSLGRSARQGIKCILP